RASRRGPDPPAGEQADEREIAEDAAQVGDVVAVDAVERAAAAGAREVEGAARPPTLEAPLEIADHALQVGARRPGVADGEAKAHALGERARQREEAALGIELEDAAHHVAAPDLAAVGI